MEPTRSGAAGRRPLPSADAILARMRVDRHHPWVGNLLARIGRSPAAPPERTMHDSDGAPSLTVAEGRALQLLSYGLSVPMAAELLGLSPHTVRTQVISARHRLGAKTATQAVAIAIRRGVIA